MVIILLCLMLFSLSSLSSISFFFVCVFGLLSYYLFVCLILMLFYSFSSIVLGGCLLLLQWTNRETVFFLGF